MAQRTRSVSEGQPIGSLGTNALTEMLALAHASGSFGPLKPLPLFATAFLFRENL